MTRDEFGDKVARLIQASADATTMVGIRVAEIEASNVMAAWDAREKEARDALDAATRDMEEARKQMSVMRAALEDFAEHGTRSDLHPSFAWNGPMEASSFFNGYIKMMDGYVRECARRALGRE